MRLVEALVYARIALQVLAATVFVAVIGITVYNLTRPVPPLAVVFNADYGCGQLPALKLEPKTNVDYSNAQVQVNTKEETLRFMPPIAYVYRVRYKGETFSLRERLFNIAERMDFVKDNYTKPEPHIFKWEDQRRVLVADSRSGSFGFSLKPEHLRLLPEAPFSFIDDAQGVAQQAIKALNLLEGFADFDVISIEPYTYDVVRSSFVKVDSMQEAIAAKVSFGSKKPLLVFDLRYFSPKYRQSLDITKINYISFYLNRDKLDPEYTRIFTVPTVGDKPTIGNPEVYVASLRGKLFSEQVIKLVYNNWDIEDVPCGTYPLKDPNAVIDEVQKKTAYLVYVAPFGDDERNTPDNLVLDRINIVEVSLAYYTPVRSEEFLQPVYVLKGYGYDANNRRYDVTFYVDGVLRVTL